jgi:hypothetical protein
MIHHNSPRRPRRHYLRRSRRPIGLEAVLADPKYRAAHPLARKLLDLPVPVRVAVLQVILPWLRQKWGLAEPE